MNVIFAGFKIAGNADLNKGHLHVVSIGTDNLLLEVWADVSNDCLHLKLRRSDGKSNEVLAESTTENGLPPGQWHHLALNVHDYIQRKKSVVEVNLLVILCVFFFCFILSYKIFPFLFFFR